VAAGRSASPHDGMTGVGEDVEVEVPVVGGSLEEGGFGGWMWSPSWVGASARTARRTDSGSGSRQRSSRRAPSCRRAWTWPATYRAAPNTVLSAIRALRDHGLVTSQQGRSTFVRDGAADVLRGASSPEFKELAAKLDDIIGALRTLDDRVRHLEDAVPPTPAESGTGAAEEAGLRRPVPGWVGVGSVLGVDR
jgi:DNA-binding transcriptional regulator YhcF (GntR family)